MDNLLSPCKLLGSFCHLLSQCHRNQQNCKFTGWKRFDTAFSRIYRARFMTCSASKLPSHLWSRRVAVSAMDQAVSSDAIINWFYIPEVSATTKMSNCPDDENVIHIIGGDEPDNQGGEGSGAATSNLTYGGDGVMVSEPSQLPTFGPSSFVVVENDRSYKFRHCKQYYTEAGCPFGDNCIYIHDEKAKTRESLAVIVAPRSSGGNRNQAAIGNDGSPALGSPSQAPPPLAPLPARPLAASTETATLPLARRPLVVQTVSSATLKPFYWRTRICTRWEQSGYCQFGSKCIFAHGEAELQRYGGGPVDREANQRVVVRNLAAAPGSTTSHAVAAPGSLAGHADAGGSGQTSVAMQRSIPSRNAWKVPKTINGIYGDWIDDTMP